MDLKKLFKSIKLNIKLDTNKNIKHLIDILNNYDGNDWMSYVMINPDKYNKILVVPPEENSDFDMYIITWNKHQESLIHNHSENGCVYKVLQGSISEEHYNIDLKLNSSKLVCKNIVGYIDNTIGYHKMINNTDEVVVTLHIYSPPNYKTTYFIQSHL